MFDTIRGRLVVPTRGGTAQIAPHESLRAPTTIGRVTIEKVHEIVLAQGRKIESLEETVHGLTGEVGWWKSKARQIDDALETVGKTALGASQRALQTENRVKSKEIAQQRAVVRSRVGRTQAVEKAGQHQLPNFLSVAMAIKYIQGVLGTGVEVDRPREKMRGLDYVDVSGKVRCLAPNLAKVDGLRDLVVRFLSAEIDPDGKLGSEYVLDQMARLPWGDMILAARKVIASKEGRKLIRQAREAGKL